MFFNRLLAQTCLLFAYCIFCVVPHIVANEFPHIFPHDFPPSNYIGGGFGSYEGFPNGQIPSTNLCFTGHWESAARGDGIVHLEGDYLNGKPSGIWMLRDVHGRVCSRHWYGSQSNYVSSAYYSDGLPQIITRGKYAFEDNQYLQPDGPDQMLLFDPTGKPLSDGPTEMYNPLGWRSYLYRDSKYQLRDSQSFSCHLSVSTDRSFCFWAYLFNDSGQRLIAKTVVSGWMMLDSETMKVEDTITFAQSSNVSFKLRSEPDTKNGEKSYSLDVAFATSNQVSFSSTETFKGIQFLENAPAIIKTREYGIEAKP
jgi:hypothetical protein